MARELIEAAPPFTKKAHGKEVASWGAELAIAHAFAVKNGLRFYLTKAAYQIALLQGDDVALLIYPHKTTGTGNISLRVRNENSKNKRRAFDLMAALDAEVPNYNTFSMHLSDANFQRALTFKKQREGTGQ